MKVFVQALVGPQAGLAEIDVLPDHTLREIKEQVCSSFGIDSSTVGLMYGGVPLGDDMTVNQAGIPENAQLALMPWDIIAGTDLGRLIREREFLRHQFPTVRSLDEPPTKYAGMLRCEKGPVKELADEGIWPFTEYVNWHEFTMEVVPEYPIKPPLVTWTTQISHPNIVPNAVGAVCVSVLGRNWKPTLNLPTVVNSLSFLLVDPNPESVFDDPKCMQAAKVLKQYNFPRKSEEPAKSSLDEIHFRIVSVPRNRPRQKGDIVHFKLRSGKPL
jgi:hypothetical protein